MSQTAFALREDWQGEIEVHPEEGDPEKRPKFGGGVLAVAGTSVDIAELLEQGKGTIVLEDTQVQLVELLDAYDPLKRVPAPKGARSISLWKLQPRAALLEEAARRELVGYTQLSSTRLAGVLDRQDRERSDTIAEHPLPEDLQQGADARDIDEADAGDGDETDDETGNPAGKEVKS